MIKLFLTLMLLASTASASLLDDTWAMWQDATTPVVSAIYSYYTNAATASDWTTAANWTNAAPTTGGGVGQVVIFTLPAGAHTATNNFTGDFVLNKLVDLTGGVLTIRGNSLVFTNFGAVAPTLTNSSGSTMVMAAPITLGNDIRIHTQNAMTISDNILGTGRILKSGQAALTLGAFSRDFSGGIEIGVGSLNVGGNSNCLGSGTITLGALGLAGNIFLVMGSSGSRYTNGITTAAGASTRTISTSYTSGTRSGLGGLINLGRDTVFTTTPATLNAPVIYGGITGTGSVLIAHEQTAGTAGYVFTNLPINNVGSITNYGDGTSLVTCYISANIDTNVTSVNQSHANVTLQLSGSNSMQGIINHGGTLVLANANAAGTNVIQMGSTSSGSRPIKLSSTVANITNNINITSNGTGAVTLTTSSGSGQFTGNIKLERDVQLLAANNVNWATLGGITGTGNVTIVAGSGWSVQLGTVNGGGRSNSWVGNLTVDLTGILVIGSGWSHAISTIPDTAIVTNNGTINYNKGANNETVGAMEGNGSLILAAGTWTVGGGDKSGSYGGVISSTGGFIKRGTGTQTLTATNTYSGGTIVSNGVLSAASYRSIPTNGYLKIVSPATVDLGFTVTNSVTALWTNGVQLGTGTYGSNEVPAFITGGGYIYTP